MMKVSIRALSCRDRASLQHGTFDSLESHTTVLRQLKSDSEPLFEDSDGHVVFRLTSHTEAPHRSEL
jgi:hypothetical protein